LFDNLPRIVLAAEDGTSAPIGTQHIGGNFVQFKEKTFGQPSASELIGNAIW
jgi:hypothetical protein